MNPVMGEHLSFFDSFFPSISFWKSYVYMIWDITASTWAPQQNPFLVFLEVSIIMRQSLGMKLKNRFATKAVCNCETTTLWKNVRDIPTWCKIENVATNLTIAFWAMFPSALEKKINITERIAYKLRWIYERLLFSNARWLLQIY